MAWVGKFKTIPDEEELMKYFWTKHYKHPTLFPDLDLQTISENRATKLYNWLNKRYPCKCVCCGYELDLEDWSEVDTILCDECGTCEACGKFIHSDDTIYLEDNGESYCISCYNKHFTTCLHCGDPVNKKDKRTQKINGVYLHDACFHDYYTTCVNCGYLLNWENAYTVEEDGGPYCKHCYEDRFPPTQLPSLGKGTSNPSGRHALEKDMANVLLRYYATLAAGLEWGSKEQFRLSEKEMGIVSQYFITTAAAELRHAPRCGIKVDDHWCLRILHTHCNSLHWRLSSSRDIVMGTSSLIDMDISNSIKFLQSAYAVFYSDQWQNLEGSFGGKNWANCCLQALNLLSALNSRDGYADNLLWECCLNASHNNSRWLSKIPGETGNYWVLYVLNMGAKCSPKEILDIFYADEPLRGIPHDKHSCKTICEFEKLPHPNTIWTYDKDELENIPEFSVRKMEPVPVPPPDIKSPEMESFLNKKLLKHPFIATPIVVDQTAPLPPPNWDSSVIPWIEEKSMIESISFSSMYETNYMNNFLIEEHCSSKEKSLSGILIPSKKKGEYKYDSNNGLEELFNEIL